MRATCFALAATLLLAGNTVHASKGCHLYEAFIPEDGHAKGILITEKYSSVSIVYSNVIDPLKRGTVDVEKLIAAISNYTDDLIVLDWEGESFKILKGHQLESKSNSRKDILSEYIRALEIAATRGNQNAKVGFYDVPAKKLRDKRFPIYENKTMLELQKKVTAYYPSGYLSLGRGDRSNEKTVLNYLGLALKEACSTGTDIYAFVNHRWHKRSPKNSLERIPISQFDNYIEKIVSLDAEGCKFSGLIWWSADFRLLNRGNEIVKDDIYGNSEGYDEYFESTLLRYNEVLKRHCK